MWGVSSVERRQEVDRRGPKSGASAAQSPELGSFGLSLRKGMGSQSSGLDEIWCSRRRCSRGSRFEGVRGADFRRNPTPGNRDSLAAGCQTGRAGAAEGRGCGPWTPEKLRLNIRRLGYVQAVGRKHK